MNKLTRIYSESLRAYGSKARVIANKGGTRSSKTYSVMQLLVTIAKIRKTPVFISVVSETLPHLRRGAYKDFKEIIGNEEIAITENKTELTAVFPNGSTIEFFSVNDWGKVKGPGRDILFINECNRNTAKQQGLAAKAVQDELVDIVYKSFVKFGVKF